MVETAEAYLVVVEEEEVEVEEEEEVGVIVFLIVGVGGADEVFVAKKTAGTCSRQRLSLNRNRLHRCSHLYTCRV